MNLDTPEGRLAAIETLGVERYNAAMKDHIAAQYFRVVNGRGLRWVASRFGRLCAIEGSTVAFSTEAAAAAHAAALSPYKRPQ